MNLRTSFSSLLLAALLCVPVLQASASTLIPTAGKTEVTLSKEFLGVLVFGGVTPGAVGPGTLSRKGIASLPITTGGIELPKAEVDHSGGLSFTRNNTRVAITSFIIDTTQDKSVLSGLVIANGNIFGRVPLFKVDLSGSTVTQVGKRITISGVALTLSMEAAVALNQLFGVTAFTENFPIGTATIKVTNSKSE
jgi:hypothetical protein